MQRVMSMILCCALFLGMDITGAGASQIVEPGGGPATYHPEAAEAIGQLYSPFCPGLMLGICTSQNAVFLRDSIDMMARAGSSSVELVEWMIGNYGEEYRAAPRRSGWALWAWLLPPAGILIGLGVILLFLRRRVRADGGAPTQAPSAVGAGAPGVTPEEEARLRAAIREIEISEDPSF